MGNAFSPRFPRRVFVDELSLDPRVSLREAKRRGVSEKGVPVASLTGEFQFDIDRAAAVAVCTEAIERLGWFIKSAGSDRIVAHAITAPTQFPPLMELELSAASGGTTLRIRGSDSNPDQPNKEALVAELDRLRDAIAEGAAQVESSTEEAVPQGWYDDPYKPGMLQYWDGEQWTDRRRPQEGDSSRAASSAVATRSSSQTPAVASTERRHKTSRRHWRKMTWAIIIWSAIFAIWIIAAIATADPAGNCVHHAYISENTCEDASNTGTGIAVVGIWFIWFFGFIALSLIWFMTRPKGRECPACGERVKKGQTTCPECGHDFATAAAQGRLVGAPSG
jgi:hypothetical protein